MPSQLQDTNISDLKWDTLTPDQLADLRDNDDRETVKKRAGEVLKERSAPSVPAILDYDPRKDYGPDRPEDASYAEDDTPLSAEEVPLENSRKDESTILATDLVRVGEDNELEIIPQ